MWPFRRKSKNDDVSEPVDNPALKVAFSRHRNERTETSANGLGEALNSASYLVPIVTDEMKVTPERNGKATIEKGSLIKFMNCENESGEIFLPAFTDWNEVRLWAGTEVSGIVMSSSELWSFALKDSYYAGIAINPATDAWTLFPQNIRILIEESMNA